MNALWSLCLVSFRPLNHNIVASNLGFVLDLFYHLPPPPPQAPLPLPHPNRLFSLRFFVPSYFWHVCDVCMDVYVRACVRACVRA